MIKVDEDDPVGELEPSFSDREVTIKRGVNAEEFYELLTEIGRGKFGTVYKCKEKTTSLELAAKFVSVSRREDRRNAEREVDIMRQLRHPRLIQLYDAFDTGKQLCVILELIHGGELFERVIDDDFVLTEKACTVFMRQICEGIEFVHQQNILHLDMKPENILCLTKTGNRIKIIDFGLARKYDPTKKLQVLFGTPEFVAPEVVNFDQIGFGTDMWSVGVICYVLLSGLSPFMGETDVETMANVTVAKYDFDDEAFNEISDDAKDFISKLLVKDKQSRMTAQQSLVHKWIQRRPSLQEKKENAQIIIEPPKTPEELDVTKENLRLFVERWGEHPNSPYLFDVISQEITPCGSLNPCIGLERTCSQQSVGGCSPSPCGSLNSSPDSVIETDEILYRNENHLLPDAEGRRPSYSSLHSLERRASDSSCFVNKKADVSLRVNLAEEIKKLSDRLYVLSTMNTDLVNNNVNENEKTTNHEVNSVKEKIPNGFKVTNVAKTDTTITNGNGNVNSSTTVKTTSSKTNTEQKNATSVTNDNSNSVQQTTTTTNGHTNGSNTLKSFITKTFSSQSVSENSSKSVNGNGYVNSYSSSTSSSQNRVEDSDGSSSNNLPWRKKNRVTNSSRDVPISPPEKKKTFFGLDFNKKKDKSDDTKNVSNGESSSGQNGKVRHFYKKTEENGDEKTNANNTKDLLLHLLDQWDESQIPHVDFHSGRHKSVSMEWSEAEKIVAKSMNTINTFFKKQSSVSSGVRKKQEALTSNGYK